MPVLPAKKSFLNSPKNDLDGVIDVAVQLRMTDPNLDQANGSSNLSSVWL